mgnify:CR=1 FL=1|jgi:hypothetical protein
MQLGEIFLCLPPRGTDSPGTGEVVHSTRRGTVAPQGRMRGVCAAEPREEAIAARSPSSVRFADSFPRGGEAFSPLPFVHKPFLIY